MENIENKDRINEIAKLLRLEHLNQEESENVASIIDKHCDLFRLPGDKLGHTPVIAYRITTMDEQPIHTKQYRFPPVHKKEIDKQVKSYWIMTSVRTAI